MNASHFLAGALLALASLPLAAQVVVGDAWVRATVPAQKATGAFMRITSAKAGRVVEVRSPVAGAAEIHEMRMSGTVMTMNAVPALELPAGKAVELRPGGYHVMLMDLKAPVKDGEAVPISLVVEGPDGKRETIEVSATARSPARAAPH